QAAIIGVGALNYPAEFEGTSQKVLSNLAVSKTMTVTSTYDHRVIQGAGSGEFLRTVHNLLLGEDDFYDEIFVNLRIPTTPIRWAPDVQVNPEDEVGKAARIPQLILRHPRPRLHPFAVPLLLSTPASSLTCAPPPPLPGGLRSLPATPCTQC